MALVINTQSNTVVDEIINHVLFGLFFYYTGELGYDRPLYDGLMSMIDDLLGPSPMHIKYVSYVYEGFCI